MPQQRLPMPEFVALMAMIFATLAFSIDAMLPAFPVIAAEFSPADPNRAQLILSFFVGGIGLATFFSGPISDAFGRLPVMMVGFTIFIAASAAAFVAPSLEWLLAARFVQGIGASAPRIVAMAMMRDLYDGRRMAQITSFVMTVFMLVPAIAPLLGQGIIALWSWRAIFLAYILFAAVAALWLWMRQSETLPHEARRPFTISSYIAGARDVLGRRDVVLIILVLSFGFGQMFALLQSTQQIYDQTFGQGDNFPLWFMATAVIMAFTTIINSRLVMTLGMKRIALWTYGFQIVCSGVMFVLFHWQLVTGDVAFWCYFAWSVSIFVMAGLTFGNLNALALQPLGHLAGMGASLIGAISTVLSVLIAVPISTAFAGTPVPVMLGAIICSSFALALLWPVHAPDGDEH